VTTIDRSSRRFTHARPTDAAATSTDAAAAAAGGGGGGGWKVDGA